MNIKRNMIIGLIISGLALYGAVRRIDWVHFSQSMGDVSAEWVILGLLFLLVEFQVRAIRWRSLIRHSVAPVSLRDSYAFYMIGYMANMILPLKAGEVIRPCLLARKKKCSASAFMATVIIERLADIVGLVSLFGLVVVIGVTQIPLEIWQGVFIMLFGAALLLITVYTLIRYPTLSGSLLKLLAFLPAAFRYRVDSITAHFLGALKGAADRRLVAWLSLWTMMIWAFACGTLYAFTRAFDLNLPWYAPVFIIVITNFGMMLPSSPGAIGLAHFLYVYALSRFLIDKSEALSFAVFAHAIGFLAVVLIGLVFVWREGLTFRDLRMKGNDGSLSAIQ